MMNGLRVGIASQTPLVRMKRSLDEIEAEYGHFPELVHLDDLKRGVDYSVTPGGVARMVHAAIDVEGAKWGLHGEWVTLDNGFPRDLALGKFRLASAKLDPRTRANYGRFKEIVWNALNGLTPDVQSPLDAGGDVAGMRDDFTAWSRVNADRLLAADARDPFHVYYVNDWQHLAQGAMLDNRPRVMHLHTPFANWTPPGWKEFMLHHLRDFDATIVSTRRYVQALERTGFERPVHQVYPWLDPRDFMAPPTSHVREFEARHGIAEDDEVVLNLSRMDPIKGQDRLIRAMPRLLKRRPRAKLVLVGNGSFSSSKKGGMGLSKGSRWRAWLEALTHDLGLDEKVVFTGHVDQQAAVAAFHRTDVFAFPSVAEGFGLAAAEAWLARKPLVVSPGAGISELVRDGENGIIVEARDPHTLADALERALALPDGGAAMGEAGRRTALEACDVRNRAPEVLEIIQAYAERRKPDVGVVPPPIGRREALGA